MRRSPLPAATCLLLAVALAVGDDADRQADEVLLLQSSHQDIAWMDDPAACRRFRVRENVVPALELVSEEPAARFTVECAAYLAEALEDLPARREEILEASRAGGLEWGATWNQPYEGLLTGEQLARQLLYGRGWLLREHGIDAKVAFNLDVPSRARQWPQLLAKAGVTGLATGRMPAGAWRWRSPDGSAVVAWSPGHYNRGQVRLKYHEGTLAEWAAPLVDGWRRWRGAAGLPPTVPLPLLHTGDCSRPLSFAPLTTAGGFEGARVRSARFDELFAALGAVADRLPELDGIRPNPWCYIHGPGHHRAIAAKRRAARLLSAAELAALAARMQAGASYPQERLRRAWLDSLADDHGWGGKDGEITDAHFRERLEVAATEAEAVIDEAMAALAAGAGPGRGVLVFNPEARPRGGLVTCPPPPPDTAWCGPDGTALPQQILEEDGLRRCLVAVEEIPAGGRLVLRPGPAMAADGALPTIGPEGGVTPHLELRLVPGGIAAVADRASGRDLVAADGTWGEVLLYDSPGKDVMGDWQVVAPKAVLARGAEVFGPWRVTARGPLLTELAADGAFGEVPLRRRLRVHHLRPRLDLALEVDWDGTPDRELRWIFPVAAAGPVTYQEPFAPITVGRDEWTGLKPLQRHPAAAIRPREVQDLVTVGGVTLVPSTAVCDIAPDPASTRTTLAPILLATRRSCHGEGPVYTQAGRHRFACTVLVHEPGWPTALAAGSRVARPLVARAFDHPAGSAAPAAAPPPAGLFVLDRPNVRLACAKEAEDGAGIVVRLVEWHGETTRVALRCGFPLATARRSDPIEGPGEALVVEDDTVIIDLGSHAVESLVLIAEDR